ncbi:MAG: hypothetical protein KGN16_25120, partial [Burkholderiales bacterium]|nr:hypothetical protein [Burkholderiales bacterium]
PLPPPAPVPPLEPRDLAARHLLQTQARLAALTPADLAAEIARAKPETPQASVDLALALAIERGPGDLARAQALLEPLVKDEGEAAQPWRALARWLAARIADQRRSDDQIERLNQQLRDTQRRLDQANDKLAALKAIERSLVTRPGTAASRPGQ